MKDQRKRKYLFANKLQAELVILIFVIALISIITAEVALFHLIFNLTAEHLGTPAYIEYKLITAAQRVIKILFICTPLFLIPILAIAYVFTKKMVGPIDRVEQELQDRLDGTAHGPIELRKDDKLWPLVIKINRLLEKIKP